MNIRKGFFGLTLILSILFGTIPPLCHKWYFEESQFDINLPENWKEMSDQAKWNSLDGLLSKNATFPLLSEIKQLNIRKQFKKMVSYLRLRQNLSMYMLSAQRPFPSMLILISSCSSRFVHISLVNWQP